MEIGLRDSTDPQMIFKTTIMGTDRTIPGNPHNHPKKEREVIIMKGESPRLFPWILGSSIYGFKFT